LLTILLPTTTCIQRMAKVPMTVGNDQGTIASLETE